MIAFRFTEGKPGANRKMSNLAKELTGLRNFRRLRQMPRTVRFFEYRKINSLSESARVRDLEVVLRETCAAEVQRRFEAMKAEFSKN